MRAVTLPAIVAAFVMLAPTARAETPAVATDPVMGLWLSENGRSGIDIEPCTEAGQPSLCGRIVWLKEPNFPDGLPKRDFRNPHKVDQSRPLCGLKLLFGFSKADKGWEDGTIYDPLSGKSYSAELHAEGADLKLRGYIGFSLLGETQTWTRLPADQPRCVVPEK